MKIAISGKGGVGKTTLTAMLTGALALKNHNVIAIDADPDANLAEALGAPGDEQITPLCEMSDLIEQRTGAANSYGGYFKLNPKVDDIPETFAKKIDNIRLLVLGGIKAGGDGCICPATALLKALLVHLILGRDDDLIMDMEAGIEHLGRATAQSVDALIVVVDPSRWSTRTALRVRTLADDIHVKKIFAVANRISDQAQLAQISQRLDGVELIGHLPMDPRLSEDLITLNANGKIEASEPLKENLPALDEILSQIQMRAG